MEKIGIFYSFNTRKTKHQVEKIVEAIGKDNTEEINIEEATGEDFKTFNNFILAVPTWFDGELPNYWDEFLPSISSNMLEGKKFALFGGGDQKGYPENFVDGLGILGEFIEQKGGELIGFTSTKGYEFEESKAQRGDQFCGLAIDIENQAGLTEQRIKDWVGDITKEFSKK